MKNTLTIKVLSPTQTIYEGEALSVSSKNSFGNFDILPYHANFITLVQNQPIIIRIKDTKKDEKLLPAKALDDILGRNIKQLKYQFDLAIIYTKDNFVNIYTNIQSQIKPKPTSQNSGSAN